jgi:chemotaxis protein methyltransferase CheR
VQRGLPGEPLAKYFAAPGWTGGYVSRHDKCFVLRRLICARAGAPSGLLILVFCRNVMIYFDTETKRKIMKEIHGTLFRGRWLLIGGSEATFDLAERFERLTVGNAAVYVALNSVANSDPTVSPRTRCVLARY